MREQHGPLTDHEQRMFDALSEIAALLGAVDRQMIRDCGMTRFEYQLLGYLSAEPARTLPMKDFVARGGTDASRVSHVMASLERRGYVIRSPYRPGLSSREATLTDEGLVAVTAATAVFGGAVRALVFDLLDPQVRDTLERIDKQ